MTDELKRDKAGFRLRGLEMTRIETFTDAAFAIALTLLIISTSIGPDMTFAELKDALREIPGFLASATLLMMFWWGHHAWSRRYGMDDMSTIVLSCLLVFTVLVYVYPLRFLFGLLFAFFGQQAGVDLGWSARANVGINDINPLFTLYGFGFTAMSVSVALLNVHAWRNRDALELNALERHETIASMGAWLILAVVGVVSTLLSVVLPPTLAGVPGWAYAMLGVIMPLYGRVMDRRRPSAD